jgi:hypothetical protein
MTSTKRLALLGLAALGILNFQAQGAIITQTLGTQDYTDGQIVTSGTFNTDASGEPSPFNSTQGGDATSNLDVSFTFSYGAISDQITSASILIGLWDADSAGTGNQVALFRLNGSIVLTSLLNTEMEGTQGAQNQVRFYTVTLPSSAYTSLAGGSGAFELQLQGPGLGVLGETEFNGGGLDFATLTINTDPVVTPTPEPSTALLLAFPVLAGFVFRRRFARS